MCSRLNLLQYLTPGGQDAGSGSRSHVPDSALYLTSAGLCSTALWGPPALSPGGGHGPVSQGLSLLSVAMCRTSPPPASGHAMVASAGQPCLAVGVHLLGKPLAPLQSGRSLAAAKQMTQLSLGEQSNPLPTPKLSHIGTDSPSITLAVYNNLPRPTATADSVASP